MPSRLRHFISTCAQFPTAPQVTYRLSRVRFLGTVRSTEYYLQSSPGHCQAITDLFFLPLIIVQKVWGEIYIFNCFFSIEKKKALPWKGSGLEVSSPATNGVPLAHAVDCDRYDHDIPFGRVINSKVHRLLISVST